MQTQTLVYAHVPVLTSAPILRGLLQQLVVESQRETTLKSEGADNG